MPIKCTVDLRFDWVKWIGSSGVQSVLGPKLRQAVITV